MTYMIHPFQWWFYIYPHLDGCSWCLVKFGCSLLKILSVIFQASVARASHVPSSCSWCVRSARRMPRSNDAGHGQELSHHLWLRKSHHPDFGITIEATDDILFGGKISQMVYICWGFKIYAQVPKLRISARRQCCTKLLQKKAKLQLSQHMAITPIFDNPHASKSPFKSTPIWIYKQI